MTPKQIAALRYMIFNAKNGTELSKRILAFLIDQSEGLTREVCLTLVEGREGYSAEEISDAAVGVGGMDSANGTTHLHELLLAMGSEINFSVHYGDFDPARVGDKFCYDGQYRGQQGNCPHGLAREVMPLRYTFWLSKKSYSREVELVTATRAVLDQIDLGKPGLYPSLESVELTA